MHSLRSGPPSKLKGTYPMPELTFSTEERDEIERLVLKHSPANRAEVQGFLEILSPKNRAMIVTEYEEAIREAAGVTLYMRDVLQRATGLPGDATSAYYSMHDFLTQYDVAMGLLERSNEFFRKALGPGDHDIEAAFWGTVPNVVKDVLSPIEERQLASA